MIIVAHRGASADAPENTLPAIELAWQQGADAVEVDLQVSGDGRAVVIHDATSARTAGNPRPVASQTLAELQRLDAGSWKGSQFAGARLPSLSQALDLVPEGKSIFLELKSSALQTSDLPAVLTDQDPSGERTILISFSLPLLRRMRLLLPRHPAYWVWDLRRVPEAQRGSRIARLLEMATRADVQGLNLSGDAITAAFQVELIRKTGLHAGCWTVDNAETARRLHSFGIDSLTTNRPGWIRQQLQVAE